MRFYGFGNYYLSSLQQGLQAGHLAVELSLQSRNNPESIYFEWADKHKVMVLLNGGNSAMLESLYQKFKELNALGMDLPYTKFHEDEQSLGCALTYVGIILKQKYTDIIDKYIRSGKKYSVQELLAEEVEPWSEWEVQLVELVKDYQLAH
jgi:hypothetical protein